MEGKTTGKAGLSRFYCYPMAECELISACKKLHVPTNIFMFGSKSFITCSLHGGRGKIPPLDFGLPSKR